MIVIAVVLIVEEVVVFVVRDQWRHQKRSLPRYFAAKAVELLRVGHSKGKFPAKGGVYTQNSVLAENPGATITLRPVVEIETNVRKLHHLACRR